MRDSKPSLALRVSSQYERQAGRQASEDAIQFLRTVSDFSIPHSHDGGYLTFCRSEGHVRRFGKNNESQSQSPSLSQKRL